MRNTAAILSHGTESAPAFPIMVSKSRGLHVGQSPDAAIPRKSVPSSASAIPTEPRRTYFQVASSERGPWW